MKQADFARLCNVTPGYISQLAAAGLLVMGADGIDALQSLRRLRGHMREERRRRAALRLIDAEEAA